MWVEFFILGGIWFYAFLVIATIAVLLSLAKDNFALATTFIVCFLLAIHFLGNANLIQVVFDNPLPTLYWSFGYFVCGVLWSFFKWRNILKKLRSKYDDRRADFLRDKEVKGDSIPDNLKGDWSLIAKNIRNDRLEYDYNTTGFQIPPLSRNKAYIVSHMAYWFVSIVLFFLEDFLVDVFDWLYRKFARVYQKISDSVFKGVEDDF